MDHSLERLVADVRRRRMELALSQSELAALAGTSVRWIRDLEHGKATVRLDKLVAVMAALGLELQARVRQPGTVP